MKNTRQCRACLAEKSPEEFKKGDKYLCILCHRARVAEWKRKNPDKVREQEKKKQEKKKIEAAKRKEARLLKNARLLLLRRLKTIGKQKRIIENNEYVYWTVNGITKPMHRHFMEMHLGRELQWGEEVHHINGLRYDNRIENLVVMERREHRALGYKRRNA